VKAERVKGGGATPVCDTSALDETADVLKPRQAVFSPICLRAFSNRLQEISDEFVERSHSIIWLLGAHFLCRCNEFKDQVLQAVGRLIQEAPDGIP
jgi:hypothetical protein